MARYALYRTFSTLPSISTRQSTLSTWRTHVGLQIHRHAHCKIRPENPFIKISEEVREAIDTCKPVVALETTIYTHGG